MAKDNGLKTVDGLFMLVGQGVKAEEIWNGIKVDKDYLNRKIKGQMKQADRLNAKYTVVIGDQELENNEIGVKNMISGESENVQLDELVNYFKSRKEV